MNEFMLFFRWEKMPAFKPEQFQESAKRWQDWLGNLTAQNKFVSNGNRLEGGGKVIHPKAVVTDGPFVEIKESLFGYMVIRAKDYDEAVALAKECPALRDGGSVEVRKVVVA